MCVSVCVYVCVYKSMLYTEALCYRRYIVPRRYAGNIVGNRSWVQSNIDDLLLTINSFPLTCGK